MTTAVRGLSEKPGAERRNPVRIRPVHPADAEQLATFYADLSDESRALRFLHATDGIRGDEARGFCTTDHLHREGFVAVVGPQQGPLVVGHLCIELDDGLGEAGCDRAEIAVAVDDRWQGIGIGRALVETAVCWARQVGILHLTAMLAASNVAMAGLLDSLALPTRRRCLAGVVMVEIDLDTRAGAAPGSDAPIAA